MHKSGMDTLQHWDRLSYDTLLLGHIEAQRAAEPAAADNSGGLVVPPFQTPKQKGNLSRAQIAKYAAIDHAGATARDRLGPLCAALVCEAHAHAHAHAHAARGGGGGGGGGGEHAMSPHLRDEAALGEFIATLLDLHYLEDEVRCCARRDTSRTVPRARSACARQRAARQRVVVRAKRCVPSREAACAVTITTRATTAH